MSKAIYKTHKDFPQNLLLGNLMFMTLGDMKIPVSELKDIFNVNNIPEHYVRDISAADAYRRASSDLKNRKVFWKDDMGNAEVCRVEVDEVRSDIIGIKRIVGIKQIDEGAEEVGYLPIAELTFNRNGSSIGAVPLIDCSDANYSEVNDLCRLFESNYNDWSVYHNKATVRNIINRIVADTHPINLTSTGLCKFTPQSSTNLLYNLKHALEAMNTFLTPGQNGIENAMEIIPVIDTDEQRDTIEKSFRNESLSEMNAMVIELKQVLQSKQTLSSRTAASYVERFKDLKAKAADYENLLGIYVDALHTQLAEAIQLVDDNTTKKGA